MRIDLTNTYSVITSAIKPVNNPIYFGIGRKTSGGVESKERYDSLEISYTMGDINERIKYAKKCGKTLYKIGKSLLKSGEKIDYQNYKIDYDKSKNQKVLYGKRNDKTGYPSSISVVTCSDMLETNKKFELASESDNPFSSFTVKEYDGNYSFEWVMKEDKLVSYSEHREGSNITHIYLPDEEGGFSYKEINEEKPEEEIASIKYCDNKKNPKFDYIRTKARTKKQPVGYFVYNQKTHMWEKQDKLDVKG